MTILRIKSTSDNKKNRNETKKINVGSDLEYIVT